MTDRELEVLRVRCETGSVKATAHKLGMSKRTVQRLLSSVYRKTGAWEAANASYLLRDQLWPENGVAA